MISLKSTGVYKGIKTSITKSNTVPKVELGSSDDTSRFFFLFSVLFLAIYSTREIKDYLFNLKRALSQSHPHVPVLK